MELKRGWPSSTPRTIMEPSTTPRPTPAPHKDNMRLTEGSSGAYLGVVLGGGCMAGGSIGLHEAALWRP